MAHEIDFTAKREGAFFQISADGRVDAWHKHGSAAKPELLAGLSAEEQGRIVLPSAGLDYRVEPHSLFDEDQSLIQGWSAFRRSDTGALFGCFRDSYTILQNDELWSLVAPLIDAGMLRFSTAGALREGKDVWALFDFVSTNPAVEEYFESNGIVKYALLANNHAYERLVSITETMVRVVCMNTLSAALGLGGKKRKAGRYPGAVLLKHTKNVKSLSVDAVTELWGQLTHRYENVIAQYEALKQRYLTQEEFEANVLDLVAPMPESPEPGAPTPPRFESTLNRAMEKRHLLQVLYAGTARGTDGEPTAWNAYMAATEALDHFDEVFTVRSNRLQALVPGGSLADKKQDVVNALVALAAQG